MVVEISTTKMTRDILPMRQPQCDPGPLFNLVGGTNTWLLLPVHYGSREMNMYCDEYKAGQGT